MSQYFTIDGFPYILFLKEGRVNSNNSWTLGHRSQQDSMCMIGIMDFTVNASVLSSKDMQKSLQ